MAPVTRVCEWCEQQYTPTSPDQKWCSPACRRQGYRVQRELRKRGTQRACHQCHQVFTPEGLDQTTCSAECERQRVRAEAKERWKATARRVCRTKTRYRTEAEANAALAYLAGKGPLQFRGNAPREAYQCPACPGWHLTKKEKAG